MSSPAAGSCFSDLGFQAVHLNRLSGGAGVRHFLDLLSRKYARILVINLYLAEKK